MLISVVFEMLRTLSLEGVQSSAFVGLSVSTSWEVAFGGSPVWSFVVSG